MKLLFKFIQTLFLLVFFCFNAKVVMAQEEFIIEIQGHSINVFTSGWEHLNNGVPTVIFDGGSTVPIAGWGKVLTEVARNAPVVAYDSPGYHLHLLTGPWEKANGSGIWLSTGSNRNEISNNKFVNIASSAVFIEGNENRVEVIKVKDSVRDLGTGNLVIAAMN